MFGRQKKSELGRFHRKVVLVTGGTDGIGLATAIAFAHEGATVAVTGRDEDRGKTALKGINVGQENESTFLRADVSDAEQTKSVLEEVWRRYGRLDILVSNAGVMQARGSSEELDEAVWDDVIATNVKGVWLCLKHAIPLMRRSGGGVIVNMGSISSFLGSAEYGCYATSKHALVGLTRASALECVSDNIRVNMVCPGYVATKMTRRVPDAVIKERVPAGRMASVEEIARVVLWLASDDAKYLVGTCVVVDGGLVARAARP